MPSFTAYAVWKVKNGKYIKLVKEGYKTKSGAIRRANSEYEDEPRDNISYIVKRETSEVPANARNATNKPASKLGFDGIEVKPSRNLVHVAGPLKQRLKNGEFGSF